MRFKMKFKVNDKLAILLAAMLWGTTGSTQNIAPLNASPQAIGALRMITGGSVLLLLAFLKIGFKGVKRSDLKFVLLAGACIAVYQPLFFTSVSLTGVAFGTVFAIGSAPVFTGLYELLRGRKPSKLWLLSTVMALLGCILLFSGQVGNSINSYGALLALGAGLSYAIYVQASKSLFDSLPRLTANGLIFFTAGLILSPILLVSDLSWLPTQSGMVVVIHLGIITTAFAYSLFAYGLKTVSSPTAVTLTMAEPFTASVLGILVFHERLSNISLLGIVLLFIGLMISSLSPAQAHPKTVID